MRQLKPFIIVFLQKKTQLFETTLNITAMQRDSLGLFYYISSKLKSSVLHIISHTAFRITVFSSEMLRYYKSIYAHTNGGHMDAFLCNMFNNTIQKNYPKTPCSELYFRPLYKMDSIPHSVGIILN